MAMALGLCVGCASRGTGSGEDDGKGDGTGTGTDGKDDGKDGGDDGDGRPPPGDDGGDGDDTDPDQPPEPDWPDCGNGDKEPGESCDGEDFGGLTCVDMGYYGGELSCVECKIDTDGCTEPPPDDQPECGNGVKEPGEECDGTDLGGMTCVDLGYFEGELTCTDACQFDQKQCEYDRPDDDDKRPENCGNGELDPGETCDGGVGDLTCEDLGFEGGDLHCEPDWCFLDTSKCW
jgi:hypothetical protein